MALPPSRMGNSLTVCSPAGPRGRRFRNDLPAPRFAPPRHGAVFRKDHAANRWEVLYSTAHYRLLQKGLTLTLAAADWAAIVGYLLITLVLGLYFRGRSGKTTEDYFVSGRNVSWWLAGTSMVATTFAADTPLAVTGLVYANGVAGNWLWWSFLPSGMMTVFLFARLWRRSGLITDVQFAEFRYHGKPAAFLRGFRAVYLGLLMNCLILGWVTKAMVNIISTSMGISDFKALLICVFFLMPFTGIYVSLGGLWGVLWTDLFQFVLIMAIVISVAWSGIRERNRAAAATSHNAFSARKMSAMVCSPSCGSTLRTTRCALGPGFLPLSWRLFCIRIWRNPSAASCWWPFTRRRTHSWESCLPDSWPPSCPRWLRSSTGAAP